MVKPLVKEIQPDRACWGDRCDITIHGERFDENATVEIEGPADLQQLKYVSPRELRGRIAVTAPTPPAHGHVVSIIVRNPGQCGAEAKLKRGIEIVSSAEEIPAAPLQEVAGDTARRPCARKSPRYRARPAQREKVILVASAGKRLEASLVDESRNGLGVLLSDASRLKVGQRVRVLFRRGNKMVKVRRIRPTPQGFDVGLELDGPRKPT